jgi:hypothetical protein
MRSNLSKSLLILLLLVIKQYSNAQNWSMQLGTSTFTNYKLNTNYNTQNKQSEYFKQNQKGVPYILTIYYNLTKNKFIRVNGSYINFIQSQIQLYNPNNYNRKFSAKETYKHFAIRFEYGKQYEINKLQLITGIGIGFSQQANYVIARFENVYNETDTNKIKSLWNSESYKSNPNTNYYSLNIFFGCYYPIIKNLSIGFEMYPTITYQTQIGKQKNTSKVYDYYNTKLISSFEGYNSFYNTYTSFSLLNFSAGIKYTLPNLKHKKINEEYRSE